MYDVVCIIMTSIFLYFQMGVKREVQEESGFDFQPTSIIKVESSLLAGYWIRFTFTGKIIGMSSN